jgi:hypothetical protein
MIFMEFRGNVLFVAFEFSFTLGGFILFLSRTIEMLADPHGR